MGGRDRERGKEGGRKGDLPLGTPGRPLPVFVFYALHKREGIPPAAHSKPTGSMIKPEVERTKNWQEQEEQTYIYSWEISAKVTSS